MTNAGFLEANTADGLRKCLADEFSSIHVFHLRGNQRTSGDVSRREGGKIFGGGSRAPIAISILVKNPDAAQHGQIYFHDIGDYLTREEKLVKISTFGSIEGITQVDGWRSITPDQHGDWLKQRDDRFGEYIALGDKDSKYDRKIFEIYSRGVATSRDAWCYNSSATTVSSNMTRMIDFYNTELYRFNKAFPGQEKKAREANVDDFVGSDPTQISWNRSLKQEFVKNRKCEYDAQSLTPSLYRPFAKQWLYFNRRLNDMVYQMPRIFPDATAGNLAIVTSGTGGRTAFTALMVNVIPSLHMADIDGSQCFPLYLYSEPADEITEVSPNAELFEAPTAATAHRERRDALTDEGLTHFQAAYPGQAITKEDVFYYVYGLLHSPDYRERYGDTLRKELPRIPCVKTPADFWAFSKAGRKLADLHINYETVAMYPLQIEGGGLLLTDNDYRVEKMRYGKNGKDKDLTTLIYNDKITIKGIPLEAYEYVVNGKPALDWVVERQCVKVDDGKNGSGIVNDANDYAIETMNNPRYPLELFQRVVTVSLETMKIVKSLPHLDIQQPGQTVGQLMEAKDEPDALTA
ncbi:helicase domain protein [Burkholderia thailandensis E264]|uniref:Helicase domain protein n=1 Tax=Burkholderia thailandensis (strain ATCC 700388 / DSM 13276 / CCUG 48851 / CIP 106301 / E264) TaxID=271848 RepID=Q2STW5_BURTA|nr:type ISP restriction/modification enzyme [Burkholderia thailandensis]ABC36707.1 helicase domain protein [Burkholderia thailandensis E264]